MDVSSTSIGNPSPDAAPGAVPARGTVVRMLGDARALAAVVLLLSATTDPLTPGMPQLRRLIELMNPCPDAADEIGSVLREVYGAVDDLRRLVE